VDVLAHYRILTVPGKKRGPKPGAVDHWTRRGKAAQ